MKTKVPSFRKKKNFYPFAGKFLLENIIFRVQIMNTKTIFIETPLLIYCILHIISNLK